MWPADSEVPTNAVWAEELPKKKKIFLKGCIAMAKGMGAGREEESGGPEGSIRT